MKRILTVLAAVISAAVAQTSCAYTITEDTTYGSGTEIFWGADPFTGSFVFDFATAGKDNLRFSNKVNLNGQDVAIPIPQGNTAYLVGGINNNVDYSKTDDKTSRGSLSRTSGSSSSDPVDWGTLIVSNGIQKTRLALKMGTTIIENEGQSSTIYYSRIWGHPNFIVNGGSLTSSGDFECEGANITFNDVAFVKLGNSNINGDFIVRSGTMTVKDCTVTSGGKGCLLIGGTTSSQTGYNGTFNMEGGSLYMMYGIRIGNTGIGTFNLKSGTLKYSGTGVEYLVGNGALANGYLNVSGGTCDVADNCALIVGELGTGTLTVSKDGSVQTAGTGTGGARKRAKVIVARKAGSKGAVFLNGGTLWADDGLLGGEGESTFVICGGKFYQAQDNNHAVSNLTVAAVGPTGGELCIAANRKVYVSQPLTAYADADAMSGFLRKTGAGTLYLSGANTYATPTKVEEGTLTVDSGATFSPNSTLWIDAGATVDMQNADQTIGGLGAVAGTLANTANLTFNGAVEPGGTNVVGTTTVACTKLAFTSTAWLNVEVSENGQCDKLAVNGDVDLSNLTIAVRDDDKKFHSIGPVLTATGTVTGKPVCSGGIRRLVDVRADGVYLVRPGMVLVVQ